MKTVNELFNEKGEVIEDLNYKEIHKLHELLKGADIPHTITPHFDGWQICYPTNNEDRRICSIVEFFGSYGNEEDLLEIMGLLTKDEIADNQTVTGFLTAEDVFQRIKSHWENEY